MNRLLEYLPEMYHDIVEFVEIASTEEREFINLEQAIDKLLDNQFVLTSDEQAIKRREKMLRIQADPTTESLEFRKQRILNRYQTKPPFTVRYLQNQLDFLVGKGLSVVSVDVQNFILRVTTSIENAAIFKEMHHTVNKVKPAHMVYQQDTAIKDEVALKEQIVANRLKRGIRLSTTWRLGITPFATSTSEVVLK